MFPKTTEYALRAMAHIATLPEGAAIASNELARATQIPPAYISKMMRRLVVAGLVTAQRGQGGGFTLARPPATIRFAEILAAVDFQADSGDCMFGWGACNAERPCPLHPAWARLRTAFMAWAEETHLGALRDYEFPPGFDA